LASIFGQNTPQDEQKRRSDAVLAEEDSRRAAAAAKTARLHKLRLAKEGRRLNGVHPP
jgi:hypothetical protein